MLTTLILTTALLAPAAPLPATAPAPANAPAAREAAPAVATGGQPPRIVEIKPDKDGKVLITVMRPQQIQGGAFGGIGGAQRPAPGGNPGPAIVPIMVNRPQSVELKDVKDLKITTASGKEVSTEDAIKALAKGGQVVASADGKSVSSEFLKMFKDEVLVLVSPELVMGNGANGVIIQGGPQGWVIPANGPRVPKPAPQAPPAPKQD